MTRRDQSTEKLTIQPSHYEKRFFTGFSVHGFRPGTLPVVQRRRDGRMERRRFLGNFQPHSRNRDHPLRRGHGRVHRNDRWQVDLCDRPEQDRLVHPPHRRRHDAGDPDSGKHREQGALRRGPVHLGLGPHAGRGVHHHAGTRTRTARTTESRPARRGLPRRRHGRGRVAAQERGALLPRNGADLLLRR